MYVPVQLFHTVSTFSFLSSYSMHYVSECITKFRNKKIDILRSSMHCRVGTAFQRVLNVQNSCVILRSYSRCIPCSTAAARSIIQGLLFPKSRFEIRLNPLSGSTIQNDVCGLCKTHGDTHTSLTNAQTCLRIRLF